MIQSDLLTRNSRSLKISTYTFILQELTRKFIYLNSFFVYLHPAPKVSDLDINILI